MSSGKKNHKPDTLHKHNSIMIQQSDIQHSGQHFFIWELMTAINKFFDDELDSIWFLDIFITGEFLELQKCRVSNDII